MARQSSDINESRGKFFARIEELGLALTYDDVTMDAHYSEVLPNETNLETLFSRRVPLKIPIVSSPMDTITEHKMAIEMARLGGLGVIHKYLSPENQALQVARVKHHLNGFIVDPKYVRASASIDSILKMIEEEDIKFRTFPVLDDNDRLVGTIREDNFDFCDDYSLLANDIMTKNPITRIKRVGIKKAYKIMKDHQIKYLPIIDREGKLRGMYIFSDAKRILSPSSSMFNVDENNQLMVGAAVGVIKDNPENDEERRNNNETEKRLEMIIAQGVDVIVVDSAHGGSKDVIGTVKRIKRNYRDVDVVGGNVSDADCTIKLIETGADGIRVGQGPGSICTTRIVTGIGIPQLTAVYNCARIADERGIPICADGGLKYSGDVAKALGAGASSVMMGSMLAGTDESTGEKILIKGEMKVRYRGMGSEEAMRKHQGARERYAHVDSKELVSQGVPATVPYRGPLSKVMFQYIGGLRSSMGFQGARDIIELQRNVNFSRVTNAGTTEAHPHGVDITNYPTNYEGRA